MSSLKQEQANRLNSLKSTGPRTGEGKRKSRQNAFRHGLTAVTVITAFENAEDYRAFEAGIASDYEPRSETERELIARLASVLWRLRRSTRIETGLFQIQGELQDRNGWSSVRGTVRLPEWYDSLDAIPTSADFHSIAPGAPDGGELVSPKSSEQRAADCFLQVSGLGYRALDLLSRYEGALWRQAAQLMFMLQTARR